MILKTGRAPADERWYIEQVLSAIGLAPRSLPNGTHIENVRCVARENLNNTAYIMGLVMGSGYDASKTTTTPFNDREGASGVVIKMYA